LPEPIVYRCANCGVCCNRLLIDRQGVRKGLPLLPGEVELFRKGDVRPAYGVGRNPKDPSFEVIAYQMRRSSCPHRGLGGCFMHAYRPAICRSYPFVPVISQGLCVVKTFDMTCTALEALAEKYGAGLIPVDAASVEMENTYYPVIAAITERLLKNVDESWFYNLKTGRWVPLRYLLPENLTPNNHKITKK
jgi:Fe-S-cluster containining protein